MTLEHSGWNEERGFFRDLYKFDKNKTDYVIKHNNGTVAKQTHPFQEITRDWNCDNDIYTLFVAGFEGKHGGTDWYTPENLLSMILEGEATIDGIEKM